MKIKLFMNEQNQVLFKIDGRDENFSLNQEGIFNYIDSLIKNDFLEPEFDFDNTEILANYCDLLKEIYKEIEDPQNKFKETYEELVKSKNDSDKASTEALEIMSQQENQE